MSSVLIVGSVAFDSIRSPEGEVEGALGGSASYASIAASYFSTPVKMVGIVGHDFKTTYLNLFKRKRIDIEGIVISKKGSTFHWKGEYDGDMSEAKTLSTCVNVFADFQPVLPSSYKNSGFVFLANIDPLLQLHVLKQLKSPRVVVCDTMNFWIGGKLQELKKVLRKSDIILLNAQEARQLTEETNLTRAAQKVLRIGKARWVIIKKGEHGAVIYSRTGQFVVPAYPTSRVKDPTGAGDTFAGALTGWLAHRRRVDETTVRQAAIIGSTFASFTIEAFSVQKLSKLSQEKIVERIDYLQKMLEYTPVKSISG